MCPDPAISLRHPTRPPPPSSSPGDLSPPRLTDLVIDRPLPGSRGDLALLGLQAGVALKLHHVRLEELLQEAGLVDGETDVGHCGGKGTGVCQHCERQLGVMTVQTEPGRQLGVGESGVNCNTGQLKRWSYSKKYRRTESTSQPGMRRHMLHLYPEFKVGVANVSGPLMATTDIAARDGVASQCIE